MKSNSVYLSELPNKAELSFEDAGYTITAYELKIELTKYDGQELANETWYTIQRKRWKPNAHHMIETYIDHQYDDMYEEWDTRAKECLNDEHYQKIQEVLNEAFKGDSATEYWSYEKGVIIDTPIKSK